MIAVIELRPEFSDAMLVDEVRASKLVCDGMDCNVPDMVEKAPVSKAVLADAAAGAVFVGRSRDMVPIIADTKAGSIDVGIGEGSIVGIGSGASMIVESAKMV